MPIDPKSPEEIPPAPSNEQLIADLVRENERLRRQVLDAQAERDQYKKLYLDEAAENDPELTAEDIATAIPARPFIEKLLQGSGKQ